MQFDRQMIIAVANRRFGPWQDTATTLDALYKKLASPVIGVDSYDAYMRKPKSERDNLKDVGGAVFGSIPDGIRKTGHVANREIISLDVDNLTPAGLKDLANALNFCGLAYAVYSTRKHCPAAPRVRVLLPLQAPLTAEEYEPAARLAAKLLDDSMKIFDTSTFQATRMMYWPSACQGAEYIFHYEDRPLWNGHDLLAHSNWHDVSTWPRCPGEDAIVQRTTAKQADPTTKPGIVGAVCRAYDIYTGIEQFLPDVYAPSDVDNTRFTYLRGSSSNGAVVYGDGKWLYSNHDTDPASRKLCNIFDLLRIHLFGGEDEQIDPGTPASKLPSYSRMLEWAGQQPLIRAELEHDRAEDIKAGFAKVMQPEDMPTVPALKTDAEKLADEVAVKLARIMDENDSKVTTDLIELALAMIHVKVGKNVMTKRITVKGLPRQFSLEEAENTLPVVISDVLRKNKINASAATVADYILPIADKHRYNPVVDWLLSSDWDGVDRWDLVYEILGVAENRYQSYIRKWFLQGVAMAFNTADNPKQADGALVLQGPQGSGKTTFFRKFAVNPEWFGEGLSIDTDKKDTLLRATSCWIGELGELDSTLKREQSALKSFITSAVDDIRAPYARASTRSVRRTNFCATVNPEDFLRDETGSRRFWVVPVGDVDVDRLLHLSPTVIHQVWLQAYAEWLFDPEGYHLAKEEMQFMQDENRAKFSQKAQYQEEIEDLFDLDMGDADWTNATSSEIAKLLPGRPDARIVGRAMKRISQDNPEIRFVKTCRGSAWHIPLKSCYRLESVCE